MNAVHSLSEISLKNKVSAEEWKVRVELAASYRLIAMYGWDDLVFTHISAKIPGTEHFLINPYGLMFEEVTASNLVKIDLQGNKVEESPYDVNPAGFTIHSAIHEVRHDANCVMHTHTAAGIAVSTQKEGILPISQQSIFVLSSLAYHDYEGVALNEEEKPRLQADLGRANNLVLRNNLMTGDRFGENVLVTEGLVAGEKVILRGIQKVRPGSEVQVSDYKPATDPHTGSQPQKNQNEDTDKTNAPAATDNNGGTAP